VAIATPISLRFNAECCVDEYAELARFCGITGDSPQQRASRFVERIVELLSAVGIPDHVDVPPDAPEDLLDRLVRNARESTPVPITLNPRKVDDAALEQMFREVLSGE
jgi:alcohol dehydrogenase class IV